jgi:hypothetical protein
MTTNFPPPFSVSEENFSLAERIESVPVHFEDKMYQYILSQNQRPPTRLHDEILGLSGGGSCQNLSKNGSVVAKIWDSS